MKGYEHLTEADARQLGRKSMAPKPSKYRNVRVVVDGQTFDSKREANHWLVLRAKEQAGAITNLERQVPLTLYAPCRAHGEKAAMVIAVAEYVADFKYYDGARWHHVDAKGVRTQMYRLKKKWLELQDGIVIEEV